MGIAPGTTAVAATLWSREIAQAAEPSALAEQFGQENAPAAPVSPAAKPFNPTRSRCVGVARHE
jgi:hypothetical protein